MNARALTRTVALALTGLAAAWALVLVVTGGFDIGVGGWTLSSHQVTRPMLWGSVTLAVFVWANGVARTAGTWTRFVLRLNHVAVATALTLTTLGLGVAYSTTVANAADQYGYVSQADLWIRGHLRVAQPWAEAVPWPNGPLSFSPLGYRPAQAIGSPDLVPVYSPGLPLLMAAAKIIGGQCGLYLVVPISGAILVLTTWGIGRRLGSSGAGLIAAWFVLASPAFLYMLALPMTDVPVAACWMLAFHFVLGRGASAAAVGGLAAGLAILVRPNLAWLAVLPAAWLLWQGTRVRLAWFSAGVAAGGASVAVIFDRLYGSPFRSGYGPLGEFFGWSHIWPNVQNYLTWFADTQTPLALAGLVALAWPARRVWPGVSDRRTIGILGLFVASVWAFYIFYLPFDAWWFLRFLLSSWPFIMLGLAAMLIAVARSTGPLGAVTVAWLVVVLGVQTFDTGRARGAFGAWHADRLHLAAATATQAMTPGNSVVIAGLHSGSVRYYGGRVTIYVDFLDPAWLDRAVEWMAERSVQSYALLAADEVASFKARFQGAAAAGRLDDPPVFRDPESGIALYALTGPRNTDTRTLSAQTESLKCVPPVTAPSLVFR